MKKKLCIYDVFDNNFSMMHDFSEYFMESCRSSPDEPFFLEIFFQFLFLAA